MSTLQINKTDYRILKQILNKYPYTFYAYGSRVKGTARKFSDLDICYQEEIPSYEVVQIEEELEESDLPFMVELVNWKSMRPTFQKVIQKDLILISNLVKFHSRSKTKSHSRSINKKNNL